MSEWNDAIEAAKNAIGISGQQVRLNFGELSAQEMRTAKAILSWAIYKLYSLKRPADQDGWLPIESAPRDGKRILTVYGDQVRVVRWGKTSHVPLYGFCLADQGPEDFDIVDPKVWRPLPSAPTPEAK